MPDTLTLSSEETPDQSSESASPTTSRRQANHLTLKQSVALYQWLDTPEHRAHVAKESDADTATLASKELGFPITAPNVLHIRTELGIQKIKPAKDPAPALTGDIDLVALHAQVQTLDAKLAAQTSLTGTLQEVITQLKERISTLEAKLQPA